MDCLRFILVIGSIGKGIWQNLSNASENSHLACRHAPALKHGSIQFLTRCLVVKCALCDHMLGFRDRLDYLYQDHMCTLKVVKSESQHEECSVPSHRSELVSQERRFPWLAEL